eukprot:TRINITY_DN7095_c0_g1_i2.p1 TRINITY_DN7095_c0_g1~~TRINITY_DN7095_c0_g1_i2.p1  ORF type:complete len:221 (-),score=45.62 TRINITY_DN7095_c0_g1_i2:118-780(-)
MELKRLYENVPLVYSAEEFITHEHDDLRTGDFLDIDPNEVIRAAEQRTLDQVKKQAEKEKAALKELEILTNQKISHLQTIQQLLKNNIKIMEDEFHKVSAALNHSNQNTVQTFADNMEEIDMILRQEGVSVDKRVDDSVVGGITVEDKTAVVDKDVDKNMEEIDMILIQEGVNVDKREEVAVMDRNMDDIDSILGSVSGVDIDISIRNMDLLEKKDDTKM